MAARGVLRTADDGGLSFHCPGCHHRHMVQVGDGPGPRWGFNGDCDRPTFTPSVLVRSGHYLPDYVPGSGCWCDYCAEDEEDGTPGFSCAVCHSFVTDGQIQFLSDCTHALAGQTVPLPPAEEV